MYTIHMFPDGRVQLVDQRKIPHTTQFVSLESVCEVFQAQFTSSPLLPKGTLQHWRSSGKSVVALQHNAHQREMYLYNTPYTLPVPNTIFLFRVLNPVPGVFTLCESAVFATNGPWEGEQTQLYGFPYGNVFEDHTICWGEYNVTLPNFYNIDTMIDMFLGTPFNEDLPGHYMASNDEQSLIGFWEELQNKPKFPGERLIPCCLYNELQSFMGEEIF